MYNRMLMDKQKCRKLIELYCCYRRLWDPNHPDYSDKKLRLAAWKNIAHKMNLPVDELKKKMDSLLGSYRRERSREVQSRLPDSQTRAYKSNWYAYKYFSFMRRNKNAGLKQNPVIEDETPVEEDNINIEEIKKRLNQNDTEAASDRSKEQTRCDKKTRMEERKRKQREEGQVPIKQPKKRNIEPITQVERRNENVTTAPDNVELYEHYARYSTDPYYSFGTHIANELRKYDPVTLTHVKRAINNIIFKADIKSLQQNKTACYEPLYTSAFGDPLATTSDISHASLSNASSIRADSPILPPSSPIPTSDPMPTICPTSP